jgi:predicted dehydrogenase/8-oxo-dGTP pyrophosphatase MutT (NUDIX family)
MYQKSQIDAVMSATPDRFHLRDITDALNNWKHIMVEKPLVSTQSELSELVKMFKSYKEKWLIISSCHPRRFDFPQLWFKEMLPDLLNELGKVVRFSYDFSYTVLKRKWLHEWLLVDHFNHEIDLLNFLFWYDNFKANKLYDTEERYEASWVRDDGITFHFSWTRFLDRESENYPEYMIIRFEKWEVIVETKTWKVDIKNHETWIDRNTKVDKTDYVERLKRVNVNFVESILWEEKPYLTMDEMLLNTSSALILSSNWQYDTKNDLYIEQFNKVDEWVFWNSKWELIKSNTLPDIKSTTAAVSIIKDLDWKIFLSKNNDSKPDRQWDLPGWHVDEWESIEEAWKRELYEEAWIKAKNYGLAWYIKFTSEENIPKKWWGYYPNPWYMAFYTWEIDWDIDLPTWTEIEKSETFALDQAINILWSDMDKSAIKNLI